jgi:hypothetical protein
MRVWCIETNIKSSLKTNSYTQTAKPNPPKRNPNQRIPTELTLPIPLMVPIPWNRRNLFQNAVEKLIQNEKSMPTLKPTPASQLRQRPWHILREQYSQYSPRSTWSYYKWKYMRARILKTKYSSQRACNLIQPNQRYCSPTSSNRT